MTGVGCAPALKGSGHWQAKLFHWWKAALWVGCVYVEMKQELPFGLVATCFIYEGSEILISH